MKDVKIHKFVVLMLCCTAFVMTLAYANLFNQIRVEGYSAVLPSWKVQIVAIEEGAKTSGARSLIAPTYTPLTATFNTILDNQSDSIEYIVTVRNDGRLNAKLSDIVVTERYHNIIGCDVENIDSDILKVGDTARIKVKISTRPYEERRDNGMTNNFSIVLNAIQSV